MEHHVRNSPQKLPSPPSPGRGGNNYGGAKSLSAVHPCGPGLPASQKQGFPFLLSLSPLPSSA